MLESKATQYSLSPEGQILWQEKINYPVPGVPVAVLEMGAHPLKPVIKIIANDVTEKHEDKALTDALTLWLNNHLMEVLEPLMMLEVPQGAKIGDDAVSRIAARVYEGLGIVPREELEDAISELTTETRADLRTKKIRLGPILAFIPALNKPAAVKLRAVLWSLYNGVALPAKIPADGIVSVQIEDERPNPDYYRAIGYPLYGGRAVRIDMLDRVISCVYDHAEKGKFQARHEMAEWLGCPIDGLYKVLEDMGHTKIYDPAEQDPKEEVTADIQPSEEQSSADSVEGDVKDDKPKEQKKPELATFRLKKGKASDKSKTSGKHKDSQKTSFKGKNKDKVKAAQKGKKKQDKGPRIITAEAKKSADDSPFAILQQLKK